MEWPAGRRSHAMFLMIPGRPTRECCGVRAECRGVLAEIKLMRAWKDKGEAGEGDGD